MSTPIMNQYNDIKKKHQEYLVLFRLGDFYELFYEDAKEASKILNITLTKRKQKDEDIPMAGVPVHTCDHYIAKLVNAGKKIALCEQIENSISKNEKIIKREVVRIITPGTLTDDSLLESKRNNYLISIYSQNLNFSVAIFDLSTQEFIVEAVLAENLKAFLEKTDPSEILINQNFISRMPDQQQWKKQLTLVPEINITQANEIILKFFNILSNESISHYDAENKISIAMILEYINLTQKTKFKLKLPIKAETTDEVQLDKFTRKNLEIIKTLQNTKKGSLIWLLDNTKTAQGGRSLFNFLNNPTQNIKKLNARHQKIDFFIKQKANIKTIIELLKEIPDFERTFSKILLNRITPFELRLLALGIDNFSYICSIIKKNSSSNEQLTTTILEAIKESPEKENYIKTGFDKELDEYKEFQEKIDQQLALLQDEYKEKTKIHNLRIKNTPLGYLVEVNNSYKEKLSYEFVLKQHLKTSSRFITNKLEEINYKLSQCEEFIKKKELEIFNNLCQKVIDIATDIDFYAKASAEVDLFSNLALFSIENNYTKPELTQGNDFEIIQGKHPILDKILKEKGEQCVANDCIMDPSVIFITGANMGGKSTYLRQQSLIILLAHVGMFVPAKRAKIGITDKIFCRISTNDDIMHGNSTFMMEMIEIALTLNQASSKSFIIFDEVGRGTSFEEGIALAQSILEYLFENLQARSIFATHYFSLKKLKNDLIQQIMMHVETDPIHFTYKAVPGVAEKSYALSVAKIAGMPEKIINRAVEIIKNN